MEKKKKLKTKKERDAVPNFKDYANPCTLSSYDCGVCLVQGVTTIPLGKDEKESEWRVKKIYNYNSPESFNYEEKLFEELKEYGFNTMHKYIR